MGTLQVREGKSVVVSNSGNPETDGIFLLQKTLINNRRWYVKYNISPIVDIAIAWDSSINFWVLYPIGLPFTLATSNSSSNNPWETTWDNSMIVSPIILTNNKVSIKKQNLGGGKLNLNKKYLYVATGTGLTPNINGLRFYDSGSTYYTNKVFYDETNTYGMWISPVGYWFIRTIPFNPVSPGAAFAKVTVSSGDPPTGNYTGGNGYIGTVTISSI